MCIAEALLTAEDYGQLPDNGQPFELVRGRLVPCEIPCPLHGQVCSRVIRIVGNFVEVQGLGRVIGSSGVVTERGPDTVRGADVACFSFNRVPRGPLPQGYLTVVPELIFEVRSPTDRWAQIVTKVGECLSAGVSVVCVLDERTESAHVYYARQPTRHRRCRRPSHL
jgi:Uma2 family endonuclease